MMLGHEKSERAKDRLASVLWFSGLLASSCAGAFMIGPRGAAAGLFVWLAWTTAKMLDAKE
jgi:hypothetical protein